MADHVYWLAEEKLDKLYDVLSLFRSHGGWKSKLGTFRLGTTFLNYENWSVSHVHLVNRPKIQALYTKTLNDLNLKVVMSLNGRKLQL